MVVTDEDATLAQMRKGILEYCLLAYLKDAPSYGLSLATALARHRTLFRSEGTLYPLLARLRRQGWVETSWRESPEGPPRRYYTLTAAGAAALTSFTANWSDFRDAVDTILGEDQP